MTIPRRTNESAQYHGLQFPGFQFKTLISVLLLLLFACGGEKRPGAADPTPTAPVGSSGDNTGAGSGSGSGSGGSTGFASQPGSWGPGDPQLCASRYAPVACQNGQCASPLQRCVAGGCNGKDYCEWRGRFCSSGGTCPGVASPSPAGLSCPHDSASGQRVCTFSDASGVGHACDGSASCPVGFVCQDVRGLRECVDRRLPCGLAEFDRSDGNCPTGYACRMGSAASPYCQFAMVPCDTTQNKADGTHKDCNVGSFTQCVNLWGNAAEGRCYPPAASVLGCQRNSDCTTGHCGFVLENGQWRAACTDNGACRSDVDCVGTQRCRDLDGTGIKRCYPPESEQGCKNDEACSSNARCMMTGSDNSRSVCGCFRAKSKKTQPCSSK